MPGWAFLVFMTNDPISVNRGNKDGEPVMVDGMNAFVVKPGNLPTFNDFLGGEFPENFAEWEFPEILEVKFADFTAELDRPIGSKTVVEMGLGLDLNDLGKPKGIKVSGRTLRVIIQQRAKINPLIAAYHVRDGKDEKSYFINGGIVATPEEADRIGNRRLSILMRLATFKGIPGISVPLLESEGGAPFMHPFRIVPVSIMGRKIGPAIGLDPSVQVIH